MILKRERNIECGFLYIAMGDKYLKETMISVASLRKIHPEASVALLTDAAPPPEVVKQFNNLIVTERMGDCRDKVYGLAKSPYVRTVFIDSDTYILDDLTPLFDVLDYFDLAIGFTPFKDPIREIDHNLRIAPEYNSGVVAYKKNEKFDHLMRDWAEMYEKRRLLFIAPEEGLDNAISSKRSYSGEYAYNDQHSFSIALLKSDLRFYTFPVEWNIRAHAPAVLHGRCKIIHDRNLYVFHALFNKSAKFRIWLPNEGLVCNCDNIVATLIKKALASVPRNVIRDTKRRLKQLISK